MACCHGGFFRSIKVAFPYFAEKERRELVPVKEMKARGKIDVGRYAECLLCS